MKDASLHHTVHWAVVHCRVAFDMDRTVAVVAAAASSSFVVGHT